MKFVKQAAFYLLAAMLFFALQFVVHPGLKTGALPPIKQPTLSGQDVMQKISQGPTVLYFWAEWCGICDRMVDTINSVMMDFPLVTVAVKSGGDDEIRAYLNKNHLDWQVINDHEGSIAETFGVRGVPAVFIINEEGELVWPTTGFSSETGMRLRLWLSHSG